MAEEKASRYSMTQGEIAALCDAPASLEIARVCNAEPEDEIRVVLVGEPGSGLAARGGIEVEEGGSKARVFLASPELRQLASALLNVADKIDGKTPLVFFDPSSPSAEEPER